MTTLDFGLQFFEAINQLIYAEMHHFEQFYIDYSTGSDYFRDARRDPNYWLYFFDYATDVRPTSLQSSLNTSLTRKELADAHSQASYVIRPYPYGIDARSNWDSVSIQKFYQLHRGRGISAFSKWVHVRHEITDNAYREWVHLMPNQSKVLGIHYRGTDALHRGVREALMVDPIYYLKAIEHWLGPPDHLVFIATDSPSFIASAKSLFGEARIKSTEAIRQETNVFRNHSISGYEKGYEVLLDTILLSYCHFIVIGMAGTSEAAIYLNPVLANNSLMMVGTKSGRPISELRWPSWLHGNGTEFVESNLNQSVVV